MIDDRLTLRAGALEVALSPAVGGCIAGFDFISGGRRQPLLRGTGEPISDVLDSACFPLVPFVNRVRNGTFTCDGRIVTLSRNSPGDISPMHGQGWRAAWQVMGANDHEATLSFHHAAGEWPWDYEAIQHIVIDEHGLSLDLSCRNLSPRRMPCGLGFHPYYPCTTDTVLDTIVTSAWTIDAAVLPVAEVPATGRFDLRARRICAQALDNGFGGWSGTASISWPGEPAALRLSSPHAGFFQVYSPAQGGVFVAEPVQHANAALNAPQADWPALGLTLLEQGQSRNLHARFDVVLN